MNALGYLSRQYDVLASSRRSSPSSLATPSTNKFPLHRRHQRALSRSHRRALQRFLIVRAVVAMWAWVNTQRAVWVYVRNLVSGADLDEAKEDSNVEDDEEETAVEELKDIDEKDQDTSSMALILSTGYRSSPRRRQKAPQSSQLALQSSHSSLSPVTRAEISPSLNFIPPTPHSTTLPLPQTLRLNPIAGSFLISHPTSSSSRQSQKSSNSEYQTPVTRSLTSSPTPSPSARAPPFNHRPKTLVLDLDETLIHSTSRVPPSSSYGQGLFSAGGLGFGVMGLGFNSRKRGPGPSHSVEVILGGRSTLYHVYKRPFVDYFLRKVSTWYTLVIFTASMQEYADPVIDWLDAGRGILAKRFFRESCTQLPNGSYSKDLSLVEEDLSRVALLDNSPISYSTCQANGIPIEGWTSDPTDEALLDLLPFLDSLRFTSDVRRVLGIRGF
ncbi:Nuclear envelope morphology protein 1 [Tulasnella sp. 419]|nr:Nuclear envelope morphology protein 1 [Tulasnella sp. 419]